MKKLKILIGTLVLSAGLAGCSSAYYASSGYANDDLYSLHDKTAIARKQQAKAEAEKAAAEARRAEWEARIAEAQAAAAENQYYEYSSNPYEDIVADTYESAYARRLRGFESPTYRMPSSYYNFRYGGSFTYATAYDPAFYNIIISGDQVWVEPKYITSMFGTWGGSVYVDPWYYGWTRPYWGAWGPSFSFGSWGWSFGFNGWYNPWYDPWWGPGWRPGWGPGWGPGWHGGHHWAYRPHNYRLDGGGRPSRYVPGNVASGSRYRGTNNSGYRTGTTTSRGGNSGSGRTYYQSGGRNNSNSSVYNGGSNRNNNNNSWNNNSWNNNRNNSNSGRSSYDSGSRSSSYNSGSSFGGSRGGSSSGGSRGYGGR